MLQLANAVELFPGSRQRRTDISEMRGHSLRVFEQMMGLLHDLPFGQEAPEPPDTEFLFGGFSWKQGQYRIWRLHFDAHIGRYTFRPVNPWKGQGDSIKVVAFAGDVADEAEARLRDMLRERGRLSTGGLNMEPFEVLRDMIRSTEFPSVGGAPQVAKVYRFLRVQPFGVLWPDRLGQVHVLGRPALPYEEFEAPVLDPDAPAGHRPRRSRGRKGAIEGSEGVEFPSDWFPEDDHHFEEES